MPMQPKPREETCGPLRPSVRRFMRLVYSPVPDFHSEDDNADKRREDHRKFDRPVLFESAHAEIQPLARRKTARQNALGSWIAQKLCDRLEKLMMRRLVGEKDVILAVEWDELGTGDSRSHLFTCGKWDTGILATMHHQGRRFHVRQKIADINGGAQSDVAFGHLRGRAHALQFIEPMILFGRAAGDELRRKPLPISFFVAAPTLPNHHAAEHT